MIVIMIMSSQEYEIYLLYLANMRQTTSARAMALACANGRTVTAPPAVAPRRFRTQFGGGTKRRRRQASRKASAAADDRGKSTRMPGQT